MCVFLANFPFHSFPPFDVYQTGEIMMNGSENVRKMERLEFFLRSEKISPLVYNLWLRANNKQHPFEISSRACLPFPVAKRVLRHVVGPRRAMR